MASKNINFRAGGISLFAIISCVFCFNSFASWIDIRNVNFKENMPSVNDDLNGSIEDPAETMQILEANIKAIIGTNSNYHFKMVGYTDNKECVGDGCKTLSLRRAQYVNKWLLIHGVPANQLLPPEGHGDNDPLNRNATPIERARNRRVEFQMIPISPTP